MFRFFSLLIGFFFLACHKKPSQERSHFSTKPNHHIFLVHGIGGDRFHFGHMAEALALALKAENTESNFHVHFFEYDTENNQKSIEDFSLEMNQKIQNVLGENPSSLDSFSIVMHSQGGLIGSIWLFRSIQGMPGYGQNVIDKLDSFVTLGTPFWGTKIAIFAKKIKDEFEKREVELPVPFGTRQLEYMEFGSDWVYHMRKAVIQGEGSKDFAQQIEHIRFLNVAAVADVLHPIGYWVGGGEAYEDDSAVPIPSSRFNFIYSRDGAVQELDWAPYHLVNALHLSPLPEDRQFYGLVQIPKICIQDRFCEHPTFGLIWHAILNRSLATLPKEDRTLHSFLIDLNLTVPRARSTNDIKVELLANDGSSLSSSSVELSPIELYAQGESLSKNNQNMVRFYFNGSFKKESASSKEELLLRITGKNRIMKEVPVTVKRGYSSFLDIKLEP